MGPAFRCLVVLSLAVNAGTLPAACLQSTPPPVEPPEVEPTSQPTDAPSEDEEMPPPKVEEQQVVPTSQPSEVGPPAPEEPESDSPEEPPTEKQRVEPTPVAPEPDGEGPPTDRQQVDGAPADAREIEPWRLAPLVGGLGDLHGFLRTRYRLRFTHEENDQDFHQNAAVTWGDPRVHRITANAHGRLWLDTDERPDTTALVSIEDTFDTRINGQVLAAHLDIHRLGSVELVRLGRQENGPLPEIPLFDGASLVTARSGDCQARLRLYGGVPVYLYESSASGDHLFGGEVELEPAPGTWLSLGGGSVRDALRDSTERNEFAVVRARQQILERAALFAESTLLEQNLRDFAVRGNWVAEEASLGADISWRQLLKTQRQLAKGLDPYFEVLAEERPYYQAQASLWKEIGEQFTLTTGFALRELTDEGDESAFNHEFWRVHVTPTLRLAKWKSELSVIGELWEAEEQAFRTLGFSARQPLGERLEVVAGSEYSLYKFSPVFGDERDDVRTWFLYTTYDFDENRALGLDFTWEVDDRDTYRTLLLEYTRRF